MGVDPGLTRLGVGVIRQLKGRTVSFVHVDVFTTSEPDPLALRIGSLQEKLEKLLDTYPPDVLALERVFAQQNVKTVMGTAQVSGVILALAHFRNIPVSMRTPSEVKAAVTGYGRAEKAQVGSMVKSILGLSEVPKPADAADALALAISEAWRGNSSLGQNENTEMTPAQKAWRAAEAQASRPKLQK